MLNKAKHKTRCRCMRGEEERKISSHGDNTNVFTNLQPKEVSQLSNHAHLKFGLHEF